MKEYINKHFGKLITIVLICSCLGAALVVSGCKFLNGPPTKAETFLYDVKTNVVTTTNTVLMTNIISQVVPVEVSVLVTNVDHQIVTVTLTNWQTNLISSTVYPTNTYSSVTNYNMTPKQSITDTTSILGTVGGPVSVVSGIAAILLGAWGKIRSTKATTNEEVAGNATQIIQVAKGLIGALPNGSDVLDSFNTWLKKHQKDADIAHEVADIVDDYVDPTHAATTAQTILTEAIGSAAPTVPVPPPTPVAATGKTLLS